MLEMIEYLNYNIYIYYIYIYIIYVYIYTYIHIYMIYIYMHIYIYTYILYICIHIYVSIFQVGLAKAWPALHFFLVATLEIPTEIPTHRANCFCFVPLKYTPRKLTNDNGKITHLNEDVAFPIKHGEFPACHVSFSRIPLQKFGSQILEVPSAKAADTVCLSSDEEVQHVSPFFE